MRHHVWRVQLGVLALFLGLSGGCAGQTYATITGVVKDSKGSPVNAAGLEAFGAKTGEKRTTTSAADGSFTFAQLPPGTYQINATCDTCSDSSTTVEVGVGQQRSIELEVNTESASTLVSIDTESTTMDRGSARIGANVTTGEISELPVNGRTYAPLALAAPGASNSGRASFGDLHFQGQSVEQNRYTLDGIDASSVVSGSPGFTAVPGFQFRLRTSVDNVQEFRIDTASYGADQGDAVGAQINLASKSGGSDWHGSLFEYLRNEKTNARNFYDDDTASKLRLNQFGFSTGGRVIKDKVYAFASMEKMFQRAGMNIYEIVPSEAAISRAAPLIQSIKTVLPAGMDLGDPNFALAYRGGVAQQDENSYAARLDYIRSDRNRFFVRALRASGTLLTPDTTVSPRDITADLQSDHWVGSWTMTAGNVMNDLRAGFNRTPSTMSTSPGNELLRGIRVSLGDNEGGGIVSPGDLTTLPNGDLGSRAEYRGRTYEITDNLMLIRGAHTLKAGVDLRWLRVPMQLGGGMSYQFQSLDGALENEDADIRLIGNLPFHVAAQEHYGAYFADDWHASANLIVNFGIRYEHYSPTREVNNQGRVFDPQDFTFSQVEGGFYQASKLGFNPRLGFAWSPSRLHNRTVIRAGAGFYQGPFAMFSTLGPIENDTQRYLLIGSEFPQEPSEVIENPSTRMLPLALDAAGHRKNLRSYQYSFSVQQSLPGKFVAQAAYVGSLNRHLSEQTFANPVTYIGDDGHPRRQDSAFDVIPMLANSGNSSFNALETSITRRLVDNLTMSGSYTWSHSIGTTDGPGEVAFAQDPNCLRCERASSSFDARHTLNAALVYDVPFGPGRRHLSKGVWSKAVGNWTVSGIWNARTGLPVNVTIERPDEIAFVPTTGTYFAGERDIPEDATWVINTPTGGEGRGSLRPNLVTGVSPYARDTTGKLWLNPAAFSAPEPGTFGNLGRNALRGPGFSQVDLQISRRIRFTERQSFTLRVEAFNILNHVNFSNPNASLPNALESIAPGQSYDRAGAAGFGYIDSTVGRTVGLGTSRQLQFGVRYEF